MRYLELGVALGLTSSIFFAATPTQALSDAQIIEKLQNIPVITLTDKSGSPLVSQINGDKQKGFYTEVYLGQKEVKATLARLQSSNPTIAKQLQIRVVTLGEVYRTQISGTGNTKLNVLVVPSEAQVKTALNLVRKTDPKIKQFDGVPLFVGVAGKPKGFVTLNSAQDKKRVVPVFFDKEQLQVVLDKFKKDQPNLASTVDVQVISLDGLLTQMRAKNEPFYNQIVIASPREMTEYIQNRPPATNRPNTAKPASKKPR